MRRTGVKQIYPCSRTKKGLQPNRSLVYSSRISKKALPAYVIVVYLETFLIADRLGERFGSKLSECHNQKSGKEIKDSF